MKKKIKRVEGSITNQIERPFIIITIILVIFNAVFLFAYNIVNQLKSTYTNGSKLAVSDAATSVMLAHGALYGAMINIRVNTRLMKDREYAERLDNEAEELLRKYARRALKCYKNIEKRLSDG